MIGRQWADVNLSFKQTLKLQYMKNINKSVRIIYKDIHKLMRFTRTMIREIKKITNTVKTRR